MRETRLVAGRIDPSEQSRDALGLGRLCWSGTCREKIKFRAFQVTSS